MQNFERKFEENSRLINDKLSWAQETIENQVLDIANYVSQV